MLGNFDDRGRLFLAENAGVNLDDKALAEQLPSRIRMLEDVDGDGVFDRSSVFADKLAFPQGALWHDGALYVTSAPSVWRLEDTDNDGVADVRREIATGFKSTGNAADVHGPFLHPNGRLYWCHGRKGHEVYQNGGGALVSKGLGARIWSCRPDGTDIRVHAGGGMDNPVEVAFNQEGEIFGTANIAQGTPRSDAVLHWVHGGVYPRTDQEPVLAEFRRTGELLAPVTWLGHVAPAGIALPRSGTWGPEFRDSLFFAEFNTRRIMRVPLERNGSTYRGHAQVFATAADSGVHFTDVIEDADGSLLLIDTGAWFRRGCPTSVVARADLAGAIYRVRRIGAPRPADPRGQRIDWTHATPSALAALLGDARVAVRDRAVTTLAKLGDAAVDALAAGLKSSEYLVRSNAVWALTRIATPAAQAVARRALLDLDARVREVACHSAFVTHDHDAAETLVARLGDDSLSVQREAARALGRLRNPAAIPALAGAAALPRDAVLTHAFTFALIEINAPTETRRLLSHREPLARRAGLIALDRMTDGQLQAAPVFAALRENHPELRRAALDVAARHSEWGPAAAEFLASTHADQNPPAPEIVARLLAAFLSSPDVRKWALARLSSPGPAASIDRRMLLEALATSPASWHEDWRTFITAGLRSPTPGDAEDALRAITTHRARDFSSALRELGQDAARPAALRIAALQLAAGGNEVMDAASFDLLLEPLVQRGSPEARAQAATVLGGAKLSRDQLLRLTDAIPTAGPVELQPLLGAFQRGPAAAEVGERLLAQLTLSPGRWGVLQTTLQTLFQRYPAPAYENAAPLIREIMNQNVAKDGRVAELESLAAGGDPARGRTAYLAGAGACLSCHRVGESGGTLGPDLSQIGRIRTTRDLLEAISFPNATIARGYETFQIVTRDGRTMVGRIPREAAVTVVVQTPDGNETAVLRADISTFEPVTTSLMPSGLDRTLEPKVLADLVAFLKNLQ
jgi:putative membrane-bound dehydrogenase-like protein